MRRLLLSASFLTFVLAINSGRAAARLSVGTHHHVPQLRDEADPTDDLACYSMGQLNVEYRSGSVGSPQIGLKVTDPRGRSIGYDPKTGKSWQSFPLAEGFVECDEEDESGELRNCAAHIQICGPVSGMYRVEVLPNGASQYSVDVLGISADSPDQRSRSSSSQATTSGHIREDASEVFSLTYSREAGSIRLAPVEERLACRDAQNGSCMPQSSTPR